MAKMMMQINLLSKHVMGGGLKLVNVVGTSSGKCPKHAKFEGLFNEKTYLSPPKPIRRITELEFTPPNLLEFFEILASSLELAQLVKQTAFPVGEQKLLSILIMPLYGNALTVLSGVLCLKWRCKRYMKPAMLHRLGGHHGGIHKASKVLQCGYYWPTMFRDAHTF
ncbi:hypothetical protein MTR67_035130 [Solanum verrucosum]|uniref:Integrase zinc-binding domain-containing protein n=1 Tax=Solanum verrucosum TaxID=315347 RepID=A0AAF0U9Q7_SOLVR|nr:hypothetical protein MTR67_035130 [Solanum verrucosum]